MIKSINKITDDIIVVRFYKYKDPYNGCGDNGTKFYKEIPLKFFTESFYNNSYFYELNSDFFPNQWWISMGYHKSSVDEKNKEIESLKQKIKQLESND